MTVMKRKEFIATPTDNFDSLSREIIRDFSIDEKLEKELSYSNSRESRIFNLAIQYLDIELADKKDEIAQQLKKLLSKN